MKKLIALCMACFLFISSILGFNLYQDRKLYSNRNQLDYYINFKKFRCTKAITNSLDEHTILLLGSSDLYMRDEKSHPQAILNNGDSDFNIMELGAGCNQSLSHTIHIGALAPKMKNKKVALIISPQWFTKDGVTSEMFASRFYEGLFDGFIKNKKISKDIKQKIVKKCYSLLDSDKPQQKRIKMYKDLYLNKTTNPIKYINLNIHHYFMEMKGKNDLLKIMPRWNHNQKKIRFKDINFDKLLEISQKQGEAICTNNPFYVENPFYDKHLQPGLNEKRNYQETYSYCDSPEYEDLKIFLDVCNELNIKPMLISMPVNGFWYDYTGFPKQDRQKYYQNIRNIAKEYNVKLLDLSEYEHTPYFLRDTIHLGWKGWVYVDKGIYEFYREDKKE